MATYTAEFVEPDRPIFKQYTITATATALSDSTILGFRMSPKKLTVKNADGAANACYLGSSIVAATPAAAGIELGAGDSYTFENKAPSEIFIVGTANAANIAFICAEF